ncbi:uncharacterized protein LOC144707374 [Wolffia australiana]
MDYFSKYVTFIPTKSKVHADGMARLFMPHVAKYWGLLVDIISDRDSRFTEYLRHYVSVNQENWVELLDVAQFAHNINQSSATGHSPFEIATGRQPLTPLEVVKRKGNEHFPTAFCVMHEYHARIEEAHEALECAAQ